MCSYSLSTTVRTARMRGEMPQDFPLIFFFGTAYNLSVNYKFFNSKRIKIVLSVKMMLNSNLFTENICLFLVLWESHWYLGLTDGSLLARFGEPFMVLGVEQSQPHARLVLSLWLPINPF